MPGHPFRGIPWTLATYASTRVIGLLSTVILARLLSPSDFGVVALATLVIAAFGVFNALGLSSVLVTKQLDEPSRKTLLTLMLGSTAAITAVVAALSPLSDSVFNAPDLPAVLAALSGTMIFSAPAWFYDAVLLRELAFSRRLIGHVVQAIVYAVVAVILAAVGLGVWSLVVGQLAGALALFLALLLLSPYRVRPGFSPRAARQLIRRGRGFLFQSGFEFIQHNADYIVVGRVLGTAPLGFYWISYRLAELPGAAVFDPVALATFPTYARMREAGEDVTRPFLEAIRLVAFVTVPVGLLMSATAEPLVRVFFGAEWMPAVGALSILGVWMASVHVEAMVGWLFNSIGEPGVTAWVTGVVVVVSVPSLVLAAHAGGITGVAWVMLGSAVMSGTLFAWLAARRLDIGVRAQWAALKPVLVAAPITWAAARGTAALMSGGPSGVVLVVSAAVGLGGYAALVSVVEPGLFKRIGTQLRDSIRQMPQHGVSSPTL